ncbi:helix-turn-helix domain-containing protein [Mycobacterium sp. URHB0021]
MTQRHRTKPPQGSPKESEAGSTQAALATCSASNEGSCANGTKFGRPRKIDDVEQITTAKRMKADGHTGRDIAKYLEVSRATLYRCLAVERAADRRRLNALMFLLWVKERSFAHFALNIVSGQGPKSGPRPTPETVAGVASMVSCRWDRNQDPPVKVVYEEPGPQWRPSAGTGISPFNRPVDMPIQSLQCCPATRAGNQYVGYAVPGTWAYGLNGVRPQGPESCV